MNIGIFGGSFDPIHNGHLLFAQQMLDLIPLDKVIFVPAKNQYMKNEHKATFANRCAMVSKAIDGNPRFELEIIDDDGNTYTYNTLKTLKEKYPEDELYFLAGDDIIDGLESWHRIEDFGGLCVFVLGSRDSNSDISRTTARYLKLQKLSEKHKLAFMLMATEVEFNISSTYIRRKIADGESIAYLVPEKVIDSIYVNGLYKEQE